MKDQSEVPVVDAAYVAQRLERLRRAAPEFMTALMAVEVPITGMEEAEVGKTDLLLCRHKGRVSILSLLNTLLYPTGRVAVLCQSDDGSIRFESRAAANFTYTRSSEASDAKNDARQSAP